MVLPQARIVRRLRERLLSRTVPEELADDFLRRLLRNLPGMAYRCAADSMWTMEFVSEGVRDLTGFAARDLVDNQVVAFSQLIHPGDRARVESEVRRGIVQNERFQLTYRIRRADGAVRSVWEQGVPVRSDGGRIEALEGFITDVTDRMDLVTQLNRMDAVYKALTEQSLTSVFQLTSGRFTYANPRCAELLGRTPEELLDLDSVLEIVHESDRVRVADHLTQLEDGDAQVVRYDHRCVCGDATEREVSVQATAIEIDGTMSVSGVMLDITERRSAERMYQKAERMEAMGLLAAGVAHDFNNVLGVIKTSADLMTMSVGPDASLGEDLQAIHEAVDRGVGLSRQLMTFGRARSTDVAPMSFNDLLTELEPMLRRIMGKRVDLSLELDTDVPEVLLDKTQAEQVVTNLVLNARDAMPEGGRISLVTRGHPHGHEQCHRSVRERPHVVLEVRDTGVGIPPEVIPRVFEPYYTTKGEKGTGLGLGNVWRIAKEALGHVAVESSVGEGTTFGVYFPAWLGAEPFA